MFSKLSIWESREKLRVSGTRKEKRKRVALFSPTPHSFAVRSRVFSRPVSLSENGELARRLETWQWLSKWPQLSGHFQISTFDLDVSSFVGRGNRSTRRKTSWSGENHSRPQSPSFLGHVVRKRGALEAAVTGCQKISDIRSRMCKSYKYHCSCS